jgi:hypothetical protein
MLLQEVERIAYGGVVSQFDLCGDLRVGDRPQRRHRLHRRECQIEPGDRLRLRPGMLRDGPGQLTGICWLPAMLCGEQSPRHLGPYPGPLGRRNRPVRRQPGLLVERGDPPRHLNPKPGRFAGDDPERHPQPSSRLDVGFGQISIAELSQPLRRQWMHPRPEQSPHLLRGDRVPGVQAVNANQASANPHPRALATLGVVGGQANMTFRGGIQRRHLPR